MAESDSRKQRLPLMEEAARAAPDPSIGRPRLGPRPLPLHLALAAIPLTAFPLAAIPSPTSRAGSMPWSGGSPVSRPAARRAADALRADLEKADPDALAAALEAEARRRLAAFLDGVARYRRHPDRRRLTDPPVLWQAGTTRLLDYGATGAGRPAARGARRQAPALLVVPSLVNRAHILDLAPDCSLLRFLAGQGLRPFLVDWDRPGPDERGFTLTDYVCGRLEPALDAVRAATGGRPVAVVGYCMGGLLGLALALRRPADVAGFTCLATPWDFHAERPEQARLAGALAAVLEPLLTAWQELPVDLIQMLFALSDPYAVVRKFRAFAAQKDESPQARRFVAVEDWLNDGVPLSAPVARECLAGWYGANSPARGEWRVADHPVRPESLRCPSLVVLPGRDHIVPPASAAVLARALPAPARLRPAAGHIGMIVGRGAETKLWQPLAAWLAGL